jgi:pimeloyl-ACP methyl ester carboxylesterase
MGRSSAFESDEARADYCRLYDEAVALSPLRLEESEVRTAFGTTHVLTAGDLSKPPLVALHGISISSTMWLPMLPTLTAKHHVRMLDVVGDSNKSVATAVLSSPIRVVEWIDDVLDSLAVERSPVVSCSLGAWMATHYAMERPERVERLAMIGPAGIVSPMYTKWLLSAMLKVNLRPSRAGIETFVESLAMENTRPRLRTDPWRPIIQQVIVGMETFRRNWREPRPVRCNIERLAASGIPVLAVVGRDETLHNGALMAQRFRQQLPHAEVVLVDDANHLIFVDQPDVVVQQLEKFLAVP